MVRPRQYIDMNSTGKLAHEATPNASATMKATFIVSNAMPSSTATTPRPKVAILETRISFSSVALPFMMTRAYKSCEMAEAPANAKPATTAKIVANATADKKPSNKLPPAALAKCSATMLPPPISLPVMSPPSKNCGSVPTSTMEHTPIKAITLKKKAMMPEA